MEPVLYGIIKDALLPDLVPVRRRYPDTSLDDIPAAVHAALEGSGVAARVPRGGEVAITAGSRGVANLPALLAATAAWFREQGAVPFLVPAMGSHGGATAEGQVRTLEELGVTEESVGCPIRSSMEVVRVGELPEGSPVYADANAAGADAIFILNRVKPHTAFAGTHESGLLKMITIGMGKQKGADACHLLGFGTMADVMPRMAALSIGKLPIIGALAVVENAYEKTEYVEAVTAEGIIECDGRLLKRAYANMPALPVEDIHVLVLDEMGKNISGAGLDGAVTGRFATPYRSNATRVNKLVVLDLTPESEGNATGMGNADIITDRLHRAIDFVPTYANGLTTTLFKSVMTPMVVDSDENALRCAVKTCNAGREPLRFIRVRNTLTPVEMLVSPELASALRTHPQCDVADVTLPMRFDAAGTLLERYVWKRFASFFS